ncbi:unnamed protein product [Acanthosepion pharaonis]|uniref:Uncharacterized protein n=1 Tax=Acanthosepion pharaonis TaxID=158019 RepID=A0A812DFT1_ACAPH|nr:unnamed protein product [Sepia pharaonis]
MIVRWWLFKDVFLASFIFTHFFLQSLISKAPIYSSSSPPPVYPSGTFISLHYSFFYSLSVTFSLLPTLYLSINLFNTIFSTLLTAFFFIYLPPFFSHFYHLSSYQTYVSFFTTQPSLPAVCNSLTTSCDICFLRCLQDAFNSRHTYAAVIYPFFPFI